MIFNPFAPSPGTSQTANTAGASAVFTLAKQDPCVRIVNQGATNAMYVRIGDSAKGTVTIACTTSDLLVRANSEIILYKGESDTIAYLQNTGATAIFVSTGIGGN